MPGITALTSAIVFFAVFGLLHSKGASDPADYCTDKKTKEQQEYLITKQTVEHILGIDHQKQVEEKKQEKEEQR